MDALEVLKRIKQETAPNTYNPDFDKNECCDIIENELKEYYQLREELNKALNLNKCQTLKEWVTLMQKKLEALKILSMIVDIHNDTPYRHYVTLKNHEVSMVIEKENCDLLSEVLK